MPQLELSSDLDSDRKGFSIVNTRSETSETKL